MVDSFIGIFDVGAVFVGAGNGHRIPDPGTVSGQSGDRSHHCYLGSSGTGAGILVLPGKCERSESDRNVVGDAPARRKRVHFYRTDFFGAAPVSAMWLGALFAFIYANALFKWRFLERFEIALAAVVFVPLVAIFMLSALGPLNIFAQRHFIIPALAFVVLTCSLTRLMHRGVQWICLSLVVAWAASSLPLGLPRFSKPPFDEIVASFVARDIKRVYTTGWEFHGLSYYAGSKIDVITLDPPMSAAAVPIDDNTGFVCRPGKCRSIFDAVRSSGIRVCGQSVKWNMRNYVLSEDLWFFFRLRNCAPARFVTRNSWRGERQNERAVFFCPQWQPHP